MNPGGWSPGDRIERRYWRSARITALEQDNGGCSSVVESRIVIPVVVGSIPISHLSNQ